ncbi:methyl-accepting chemotaxis protein [Sporosarcina ureae]|uniref:Chemotaxis protein n=1 Tax=Sporosarcina ureae TaxID=1571 RepID=A0ABM6JY11_SPOUR|nr:methyl-accepting chemotaxis protein [Sporosarcina ureae]ARF14992.1 chemotaxis protein [Sporosarcina ureae]
MKKSASIAMKLSGLIIALFLLLFLVYSIVTSVMLHRQSIKDAEEYALESANKNSLVLSAKLSETNEMLRTTSHILETLQTTGDMKPEEVIRIIKSNLQKNDDATGMAAVIDQTAFAKGEAIPKNLLDGNQQFIPYVFKEDNTTKVEPLSGMDDPTANSWYTIPKNEARAVLTEPYSYETNGQTILMTTISVPMVDASGNYFGLLTTDLSIDFLTDVVKTIQPKGGYASVITDAGYITANSLKAELNNSNMADAIDWNSAKVKLDTGELASMYVDSQSLHEQAFNAFAPINLKGINEKWSVQTVTPRSEILDTFTTILWITIISAIVIVLLMSSASTLFIYRQLRPLKTLQQSMETAATGDLTMMVDEQKIRHDEIGLVALAYNDMLRRTNAALQTVQQSSGQLSDSSTQVTYAFEELVAANQEVSVATDEIAQGASKQSEDTEITSLRISDLADRMDHIHTMFMTMNELSTDASNSAENGMSEVKKLRDHNTTANEVNKKVQLQIQTLTDKITSINQVIQTLHDITASTNLLALNASIEAARAGESGKGFAVVANEVRQLAEQSRRETEVIQETVKEILSESQQTVDVIELNMKSMDGQNQSVSDTEESFVQNAGIVDQIRESITELSEKLAEMMEYKDEAILAIQNVSAISEQTAASSEQVSASAAAQQGELEQVADSTNQMNQIAGELRSVVERFKLS